MRHPLKIFRRAARATYNPPPLASGGRARRTFQFSDLVGPHFFAPNQATHTQAPSENFMDFLSDKPGGTFNPRQSILPGARGPRVGGGPKSGVSGRRFGRARGDSRGSFRLEWLRIEFWRHPRSLFSKPTLELRRLAPARGGGIRWISEGGVRSPGSPQAGLARSPGSPVAGNQAGEPGLHQAHTRRTPG